MTRFELFANMARLRRLQIPVRARHEFGGYVAGQLNQHPLWQLEQRLLAQHFGEKAIDRKGELHREPWPKHALDTIAEELMNL